MNNNAYKERFLKYVSFETTSNEESPTHPSTAIQKKLSEYLVNELHNIGVSNAYMDEKGFVYGYIKSNCASENTIGLIAHVDTSSDASGKNVKPNIIEYYNGEIITLNEELGLKLDPEVFPRLNKQIGHELITTDGTTLLGADDKSGIAIIMTVVDELLHSNINYPNIIVTFTPDEEIGRGTDGFDIKYYKDRNCHIAYTLDGGAYEIFNYENFNAARAVITINGKSIHTGLAKGKLINSSLLAMEFNSMLPEYARPELTEGYEGFNHLTNISGTCEKTIMKYIIRNHDKQLFEHQKALFKEIETFMNQKYGYNAVSVIITDTYYNMKEEVDKNYQVIKILKDSFLELGINPIAEPIRGGTDGASLTYQGIITPNIGTGGQNFHGPYEYVDVNEATLLIDIVKNLLKHYL